MTVAAVASVLMLGLTGCGTGADGSSGAPGGGQAATPRPGTPSTMDDSAPTPKPTSTDGSTYVFNTAGEEQGFPDRMPKRMTVSEFTTFTSLSWSAWTDDTAVGEGRVQGTWCLPDCADRGYPADLRLITPRPFDGREFFTRYTVEAELPAKYQQAFEDAEADGSLMTPS
ncbi:MAG: hypothetical protein GEV11_18745 [Streptosporangiales bacterium]|nr:hypothetical protein [Streptosporangiales bacterium]